MILMTLSVKERVDKLDFIKIKNSVKNNVQRMRRQAANWEKTFAKDISDKGLLSKIHKELVQLDNKKINNSWGTWEAQSVECLTSAQVMISQFMSSSPAWSLLLSVQSPLRILCPLLPAPPPTHSLSQK